MTTRRRVRFFDPVIICRVTSSLAIATVGLTTSPLAQLPSADSVTACRSAFQVRAVSPDSQYPILTFDRPAALLCTGLPPTADTLNLLEALVNHVGSRDHLGQYALIVANGHFRAARMSQSARDYERALASLRIAYRIKAVPATGFLLALVAAELASDLQKARRCSDLARARDLLAEARAVFPEEATHGPPDWDSVELKAQETFNRRCGRRDAQRSQHEPPQN